MIHWRVSKELIPYEEAVQSMETQVQLIYQGESSEQIWLLEHPSPYTGGTSAKKNDLLDVKGFPVYETGRGGQYTYHGPGQRVAYVMIDLSKRDRDVRAFVTALEQWIIDALTQFDIKGERRCGRVGIWVTKDGIDHKIAALGIRLRRWVSFHGIAINVNPDLTHFQGIVPCGLNQYGVTSMHDLGVSVTLGELDEVLREIWERSEYLMGVNKLFQSS